MYGFRWNNWTDVLVQSGFVHMMKIISKWWNSKMFRHCERSSYFTTIALGATLLIGWSISTGNFQHPMYWFYIALLSFLGGWIGVIIYRIKNRKKLLTRDSLFFWNASK